MRKREREAWAKWRGLAGEQKRSGQSAAAFCRERGLCAPHFFAWRKRLSQASRAATEQFAAVRAAGRPPAHERFVAVNITEAAEAAAPAPAHSRTIEIQLGGERRIVVEPGFDADRLRAVLAALETQA